MATKLDHLRALARVCRQFGGTLAIVSQPEFDRLFEEGDTAETPWHDEDLNVAPFTCAHGLWWRRKIIYAVQGREEIGSILHEMGHVFAAPHHPHCNCGGCHEWGWLGWEIAIARHIGVWRTWSQHNANYITTEGGSGAWGGLSPKQRRNVVADRLLHARKIGALTEDGHPRSIR